MIHLPREIIEQIKFFCESKGYGFCQAGSNHDQNFTVLVIGTTDLGVNTANVLAAHALLTAVVSGVATGSNDAKEKEDLQKKWSGN